LLRFFIGVRLALSCDLLFLSWLLLYALVIFVNVALTTLKIPHRINSSGVQTTLFAAGPPADIDPKIYWHRPHGRAGGRDVPEQMETLANSRGGSKIAGA
jgi:hypothetical protein